MSCRCHLSLQVHFTGVTLDMHVLPFFITSNHTTHYWQCVILTTASTDLYMDVYLPLFWHSKFIFVNYWKSFCHHNVISVDPHRHNSFWKHWNEFSALAYKTRLEDSKTKHLISTQVWIKNRGDDSKSSSPIAGLICINITTEWTCPGHAT